MNRFHQTLRGEVSIIFAEEANAHNYRNTLAEQHVYWQEHGRRALNLEAGFERAAHVYQQAARDENHVAVAQVIERSTAEMRETLSTLESEAKHSWTSHQATLLNDMSSVAGDALKNQKRSLLQ